MTVSLVLTLVGVFHCYVSCYAITDYALYFPNHGVADYANIWGMRSLTRFTVCFWMKSSASNAGIPFSYAVPRHDNELVIYNDHNGFGLELGPFYSLLTVNLLRARLPDITCFDGRRKAHQSANDGRWHHICVSWQSNGGEWQFYKDGVRHMHARGHRAGHTVRGGGSVVLGQEQDSVGGGFDSRQSFQGSLTNVNVWSYVLSSSAIRSLLRSCLSGAGDVYKWSDFIYGVKGKTAVVIPSPCYPLSTQG